MLGASNLHNYTLLIHCLHLSWLILLTKIRTLPAWPFIKGGSPISCLMEWDSPSIIYSVLCFQEHSSLEINFHALCATQGYFIFSIMVFHMVLEPNNRFTMKMDSLVHDGFIHPNWSNFYKYCTSIWPTNKLLAYKIQKVANRGGMQICTAHTVGGHNGRP
jgi:hypothetical protein